MEKEITTLFEQTIKKFRELVESFNQENINLVPFENSWTGAQVTDHVLKSLHRLPNLLGGNTEAVSRNPEEKKKMIDDIFLDMDKKMKSPDFILPATTSLEKAGLLERIDSIAINIMAAMKSGDLTRLCTDAEIPGMGQLTCLEWCWFAIDHTKRHTMQLENILKAIKN
jgi:hypothetical protein